MAQPFLLPTRDLKGQGEAAALPPSVLKAKVKSDEDYPLLRPRHRASQTRRDAPAARKERSGFSLLAEERPDHAQTAKDKSRNVTSDFEAEQADPDIRIDNWMGSLTDPKEGDPSEYCEPEVRAKAVAATERVDISQEAIVSPSMEAPLSKEAALTGSLERDKPASTTQDDVDDLDAHLRERRLSSYPRFSGRHWSSSSVGYQSPLESVRRIVFIYSIVPVLIVFYALIGMSTSNALIQSSYPMATWAAFAIWGVVSHWNVLFHLRASIIWQIFVLLGFAGTSAMGHPTPLDPFGLSEAIFLAIVSLALVATIALDLILSPRGHDRFRP